jgi:hypothetical protein
MRPRPVQNFARAPVQIRCGEDLVAKEPVIASGGIHVIL